MRRCLVGLLVLGCGLAAAAPAAADEYGPPELISHFRPDEQPAGSVSELDITPDGRYVVYATDAPNLPPDPAPVPDGSRPLAGGLFRYDRQTGATDQVAYRYGDDGARMPSISADGRFVLFATDRLLPQDDVSARSTFLRDMTRPLGARAAYRDVAARADGEPTTPDYPITVAGAGTALSDDGTRVLLDDNGVYLWRDLRAGTTRVVTTAYDPGSDTMTEQPVPGNQGGVLSADGTTAIWATADATAFTPSRPGEENAAALVWRRIADGPRARTRRAVSSVDLDDPGCTPETPVTLPSEPPTPCDTVELDAVRVDQLAASISRDGYTVLFAVDAHRRGSGLPDVADAYVTTMFPGDTRKAATTPLTRVIPAAGGTGDPAVNAPVTRVGLSPDGRYAALITARITFALSPPAFLGSPSPSVGAGEVYVVDRAGATVQLLTRAADGGKQQPGDRGPGGVGNGSSEVVVADDAAAVAFASNGINLVPGDLNDDSDAFVASRPPVVSPSGITGPALETVPPVPGPVVGEGELVPAPGPTPSPAPVSRSVTVPALRVGTQVKGRALRVRVRVPARGRVTVVARRGRTRIARARTFATRAGRVTLRLRRRAGRAQRVRVAVTFRPSVGGSRTLHQATTATLPRGRR